MFKLMKLEFAKMKVSSIFRAFIIIIVSILAFSILTGSIVDEGERMFNTTYDMLIFGELLCRICFGIFGSVLLGKMIIGEYKNGTVQTLFTYPISRKKLMGCKLCMVFAFTFVTIWVSEIFYGAGMLIANQWLTIVEQPVTWLDIAARIPGAVFSAAATAGLSMIPLYFGMRKKSVSATIVAGVVINSLVNSSFGGNNGQLSLFSFSIVPTVLCIIGLVVAYCSYRDIEKKDLV
jgi:ABC-type transport system involved in multi-copper enzyme maturation permease subunit